MSILRRSCGARLVAVAALLLAAAPAAAHEIPNRVTVIAFVKPEPGRLRIVLRTPLEAMRDVHFPERAPGYLDVARAEPLTREAAQLWIANFIHAYEGGRKLPDARVVSTRIALPSERTLASYGTALAGALASPLADSVQIPWQQALIDVVLEYPIASERSEFSIRPELGRLGMQTTTVLRYVAPTGEERAYQYVGDPGLLHLDPRWHHAAWQFATLGIAHVLGGIDHLLFVLCLVIPFRRVRPVVLIVTSFTVAQSISLASAALGIAPDALWFPALVETLVAASILYMALENVVGPKPGRRWWIAFGVGLAHGFAFSFALRETLQFAGSHLVVSLLTFNVGVEIGQLLVPAVAVPLISLAFKHAVAQRIGIVIASALVAHTAWHWMIDRGATLAQYQFDWPALDMAFAASAMRAAMVLLITAAAAWGLAEAAKRLRAVIPTPSAARGRDLQV